MQEGYFAFVSLLKMPMKELPWLMQELLNAIDCIIEWPQRVTSIKALINMPFQKVCTAITAVINLYSKNIWI